MAVEIGLELLRLPNFESTKEGWGRPDSRWDSCMH